MARSTGLGAPCREIPGGRRCRQGRRISQTHPPPRWRSTACPDPEPRSRWSLSSAPPRSTFLGCPGCRCSLLAPGSMSPACPATLPRCTGRRKAVWAQGYWQRGEHYVLGGHLGFECTCTCHPAVHMHTAADWLNIPFPEQNCPFRMPSAFAMHASAPVGFPGRHSESATCSIRYSEGLTASPPGFTTYLPCLLICKQVYTSYLRLSGGSCRKSVGTRHTRQCFSLQRRSMTLPKNCIPTCTPEVYCERGCPLLPWQ